jgi:NAD(P)H-dependent FMN reductase
VLKVGVILGSTRPNRFADKVKPWILEGVAKRSNLTGELLDLREVDLPFIREPIPPGVSGGVFSDPKAQEWGRRLAPLDAFIAVTPEYNHGPNAALKNALDSAYLEWQRKPIAFVGYGGVGAARAIETLRGVVIELQMAPIRYEVNIGAETFARVWRGERTLGDFPYLARSRDAMLDHLVWWAEALKAARQPSAAAA